MSKCEIIQYNQGVSAEYSMDGHVCVCGEDFPGGLPGVDTWRRHKAGVEADGILNRQRLRYEDNGFISGYNPIERGMIVVWDNKRWLVVYSHALSFEDKRIIHLRSPGGAEVWELEFSAGKVTEFRSLV